MFKATLLTLGLLLTSCTPLHPHSISLSADDLSDSAQPSAKQVIATALTSVGHIKGVFIDSGGDIVHFGCSAFAIDVHKFLTAAHCVRGVFTIDGIQAFPLAVDANKDIALLMSDQIRVPLVIRTVPLERFEQVYGLGYGYSWLFPTITSHRVLFLHFTPEDDIYPGVWFLNPFMGGMSGGVVIDEQGQVVSIIQRSGEHVGYGIGSDAILEFLAVAAKPPVELELVHP